MTNIWYSLHIMNITKEFVVYVYNFSIILSSKLNSARLLGLQEPMSFS